MKIEKSITQWMDGWMDDWISSFSSLLIKTTWVGHPWVFKLSEFNNTINSKESCVKWIKKLNLSIVIDISPKKFLFEFENSFFHLL